MSVIPTNFHEADNTCSARSHYSSQAGMTQSGYHSVLDKRRHLAYLNSAYSEPEQLDSSADTGIGTGVNVHPQMLSGAR